MSGATSIRAYVGPNGGGKTLAAVATAVAPALEAGREVVANINIDHPRARVLRSWRELDELRNCVLLLDEITSVFPSREFSKLPPQVARQLNQLRKVDVEVHWTAPHWQRCDVILRECTQLVTVCAGSWVDPWVRARDGVVRDGNGKRVRRDSMWPSYRFFHWKTYDAVAFEDFTLKMVEDVRPLSSRWYRRNAHAHQWLYDTMEPVYLMDHLDEYGVCVNCGGNRRRPSCSCEAGAAPNGAEPAGSKHRTHRGSALTSPAPVVGPEVELLLRTRRGR